MPIHLLSHMQSPPSLNMLIVSVIKGPMSRTGMFIERNRYHRNFVFILDLD
jgi:hypothetical protein